MSSVMAVFAHFLEYSEHIIVEAFGTNSQLKSV